VKVRFLADADLNKAILTGVLRREPAIDFLSAHTAGLRAMDDAGVLALAAEQGRILVSHDVGTMPVHFRTFQFRGG
jgi:predicted nuclease of predicted toxin-antitoxin system